MKLRCVAIDDEPLALSLITQYVAQFPKLELVQTFNDAIEGAEFLANNSVDLLFIDINMPDITGLELVENLTVKPMIIFTTAHKKFALEGFELEAMDYLLKPIALDRFSRSIGKAIDYFELKNAVKTDSPQYLFVRSEYKMVKIDVTDIDYIEGLVDYVKIHLLSSPRPILSLMTMKAVLEKLPADQFSRIHRSFIVPNINVKSILNKKAELISGKTIPISNSNQDFIDEWMKK
ncbi:LytTR family two component transcriptional regulator [Arcicella aurantiaca]|uniref:LytTR family two component transcriptional regulator n=1 Tax=Arcicella aurantiaca TaxID=591202 RepID=A0A316EZ11_9BACT|nr:LytTR family DNA-binding domain-containing protein [Arcicella aurantiaca]PWK28505.1 LytTR family two component transcriptional regulator [Arcicella aurantiaca]